MWPVVVILLLILLIAIFSSKGDDEKKSSPASPSTSPPTARSSPSPSTPPTSTSALNTSSPPGNGNVTRSSEIIRRFNIPAHCLVPKFDFSYASSDASGCRYGRGGVEYIPPFNFDKLGISTQQFRDTSFLDAVSGWHVAYHGTDPTDVRSIIEGGLKSKGGKLTPKHGSVYGNGIYCSPDPSYARTYAGEKRIDDKETDVVLFARVRPGSYSTHANGKIWLVPNPEDIRCIAVLFYRS